MCETLPQYLSQIYPVTTVEWQKGNIVIVKKIVLLLLDYDFLLHTVNTSSSVCILIHVCLTINQCV